MKQLITILFILISLTGFSQTKSIVTVSGVGSGSNVGDSVKKNTDTLSLYKGLVYPNIANTTTNTSNILLKRNISDTAGNAGVPTIFQLNKSKDSLQVNIQKNTDSFPKKWGIYGMSGLSSTANFIGNTDNVPIFFRVNNIKRGGFDTATYNGSITTGLFSLGNWLTIPTPSKSALFISDSARLSGDEFRFGATVVVTGTKVGGTASQGQIYGANFEPRIGADNTQNWTSTDGMQGVRGTNNVQRGATGTLTWGRSVMGTTDYSGMTITNSARFYAQNTNITSPAVVTNAYGLYIEALTGATNNYGIYNLSGNNQILAGGLGNGVPILNMTGSINSYPATSQIAFPITITTGGSDAQPMQGLNLALNAGYTGASFTGAGNFANAVAGTGSSYGATTGNTSYRPSLCNVGLVATSIATTTGMNVAGRYLAGGGNTNYGIWAASTSAKNSASNVGAAIFALNTGSSPTYTGAIIALQDNGTSAPTLANAALIVENGSQAAPIALFRDNGTTKVTIADGGAMTSTSTITATQFNYSALSTAPSSASDTGTTGEVRVTNGFIYVCVATNTWQRAAITTW